MFGPQVTGIYRQALTPEEVAYLLKVGDFESCANPGHVVTLDILREHFGITLPVPDRPPTIKLVEPGDEILVLGLDNPKRLAERREYTRDEVLAAGLSFAIYTVATTG
jgi:hypothetical protein